MAEPLDVQFQRDRYTGLFGMPSPSLGEVEQSVRGRGCTRSERACRVFPFPSGRITWKEEGEGRRGACLPLAPYRLGPRPPATGPGSGGPHSVSFRAQATAHDLAPTKPHAELRGGGMCYPCHPSSRRPSLRTGGELVKPRLLHLRLTHEQLEGVDGVTSLRERELRALETQPPDPPHRRPLRVVRLVLDHKQGDRQRVLEVEPRKLSRRGLDEREVTALSACLSQR